MAATNNQWKLLIKPSQTLTLDIVTFPLKDANDLQTEISITGSAIHYYKLQLF